ncbi:hypothetical protein [Nocardia gipuzkoensis]
MIGMTLHPRELMSLRTFVPIMQEPTDIEPPHATTAQSECRQAGVTTQSPKPF